MAQNMTAEKAVADMTPQEAQAELAKRETDKMTRRAALAKIGMRAGMAVFAALSVDDLARLVAKRMEQQAGQTAALDKVARELRGAGVAFADSDPLPPDDDVCTQPDETGTIVPCDRCKKPCKTCCDNLHTDVVNCGKITDPTEREKCNSTAGTAFDRCVLAAQCQCAC